MGSSIAGIFDRKGRDVFGRILGMLSATRHRGSGNIGIAIMGRSICVQEFGELDRVHMSGNIGIGVVWSGTEKKFGQVNDSFRGILDGGLYEGDEQKERTPSKVFGARSDIETIVYLLREGIAGQNTRKDSERLIRKKLRNLDGVYALAILHENKIFIARDTIGVKPLYISQDEDAIAFCSEKKGLWSIGLKKKICSLEPGSFAIASKDGLRIFRRSWISRTRKIGLEESVKGLGLVLRESVKKRVERHDSIGLLFSGGLDSTVLAIIAKDLGKTPYLYCVGTRKSKDMERARRIAGMIDLPLRTEILRLQNIERNLAKIVYGIETNDFRLVAIGIPVFFASKLAKDDGIDTMLSGQGADELFGGYARYLRLLEQEGYDELQNALEQDVMKIAELNIQRDDHASMMNGVEIQLPYLDWSVVRFGLGIPIEFKIQRWKDGWKRKFVLRKLAEAMDLPEEVCWAPKIAMQYGSGSEKSLGELAKARGFSKTLSKQYGYVNNVQLFVECIAKQVGIPMELSQINNIIDELGFSL